MYSYIREYLEIDMCPEADPYQNHFNKRITYPL